MRVAYWTAGTVGAGHLVRGLAIAEGLRRAGGACEFRLFGPRLDFPGLPLPAGYTVAEGTPRQLASPELAPTTGLARALQAYAPELLLVDLFWAPLHHLLPTLGCPAWLLLRSVPRSWFTGPPGLAFDPRRFARTFTIEPFGPPLATEALPPIVVRNPGECRPPAALRERLGLPPGQRLTVLLHAGRPGEAEALRGLAGADGIACQADLFQPGALFPAAEWLGGADRILCGAGYNAFWEARWLGYAGRCTFHPFPRTLDDQRWRATRCREVAQAANGADVLARHVLAGG